MSYKVNSFSPFDKHFFGKPLTAWARKDVKVANPSDLKMSSFDDFNKYFDTQMLAKKLERTPEKDSYINPTSIMDQFSNIL